MTKYALSIAMIALSVACSGAGVSTTARDDMGEDGIGGTAGDGGDGADGGDAGDGADAADGGSGDGADDAADDAADGGDAGDAGDDSADGADDSSTNDDAADDGTGEPVDLEGVWVSEGENIAPILVDLTNAVSITGTFTADTFTVFTVDSDGQEVNQSGIYTAEASGVGNIYTITLEQTVPQPVTAEGIFEIDNSVSPPIMMYEVVQTSPSVGAQTPTAELGFGGTNLGPDLTQIFVRN